MSQPADHSPALDSLYEALSEVQAHLGQHHQERQQLLGQIEAKQRELSEQRQQAAKAGERDTYDRLSEDLAKLTRAYRVASEDPDADPLDQYQWTDEEPAAPTSREEPTAPSTDRSGGERPASDAEPPGEGAAPSKEPGSPSETIPGDAEAGSGAADASAESLEARPDSAPDRA